MYQDFKIENKSIKKEVQEGETTFSKLAKSLKNY